MAFVREPVCLGRRVAARVDGVRQKWMGPETKTAICKTWYSKEKQSIKSNEAGELLQ